MLSPSLRRRSNLTFFVVFSLHFIIFKRLDLPDHYSTRSPEGRARSSPEFLRLRVIPDGQCSPSRFFFSLVIYTRTLILPNYCNLIQQFFHRDGNILSAFSIGSRRRGSGDSIRAANLPLSSPPCASMCSTSTHGAYGRLFFEISKFHGGIDVRRRFGRRFHSKAEPRKWTGGSTRIGRR